MNFRFPCCVYVLLLTALSFPVRAEEKKSAASVKEFTKDHLIASGERGGPLTPTSAKFTTADNRSFGEAMTEWNAHKYKSAVEKMRAHIAKYPQSPWAAEAELHVGCFNYYAGRYNDAEQSFKKILGKHKNGQIARKTLIRQGILCAESGRYEEAGDCFKECIKLKPTWQQATMCQSWLMKVHRLKMTQNRPKDCGAQAIKRVLNLKGIALPEESETPEEASTFAEMTRIAASHGLTTSGVNLSYEELTTLKEPAIVHIDPPHFLVVERADARHVFIIDPQGGKRILKKARFIDMWDGKALVFGGDRKNRKNTLAAGEMEETEGGCCGLALLADLLGIRCYNLAAGGPCGGSSCQAGGSPKPPGAPPKPPVAPQQPASQTIKGSPEVSINPKSLNILVEDTPIGYQPARGPEVAFTITYNSLDPGDGTGGPSGINYAAFGNKWSSNYNSWYAVQPGDDSDDILVMMPDGRRDLYVQNGPYTYTSPPEVYHTLVRNLDGSFTLTLKGSKTKYHYSATDQALSSIEDRWGNTVTLARGAQARLTSVTDAAGRVTTITPDDTDPNKIKTITDPLGRTANFTYDTNGNLASVTDMGGYTYSYTYLCNPDYGYVMDSLTRPTGTWTFTHAFPDHVEEYPPVTHTWETYKVTVTDPRLNTETYYWKAFYGSPSYPGNGMYQGPTEVTDANGNVTRYYFSNDANGYPNLITKGDVEYFWSKGYKYEAMDYDVDGNVTAIKEAKSDNYWVPAPTPPPVPTPSPTPSDTCPYRTTNYTWSNGNVTSTTDAGGHQTVYTWNADDDLTAVTDPLLKTTAFGYTSGDLTSITPPSPFQTEVTQITYNPPGKVETVTNARHYTTGYVYDTPYQRLTDINFPDGTTMYFGYDVAGHDDRVKSVTYPSGLTIGYTYDNLDRVTRVNYPDGTYAEYTYLCCGLESARDRMGRVTNYSYIHERLDTVTDPRGYQTKYLYDTLGNITEVQATRDGTLKMVVQYDYATPADDPTEQMNHLNNLSSITSPGGKTKSFTYWWSGELRTMVQETGGTVTYAYDGSSSAPTEGRLTSVTHPGSESVAYGYDNDDRVTTVTNSVPGAMGWVTTYGYDALGRISSVDGPDASDTVTYLYDAAGNRNTMTVNGSIATGYAYDPTDRLASVTSPYASAGYGYADGLLDTVTYSNGDTVNYGYDSPLKRLQTLQNRNSAHSVLASYTYGYGMPETITSITDNNGFVEDYLYDNIYRLTREKRTYPSGAFGAVKRFGYDELGNRTRFSENGRVDTSTFTQDNQTTGKTIGASVDVIGKAKTGAWNVTVQGTPVPMESDGTWVAEGLSLPVGANTITASGNDPTPPGESDSHTIHVTKKTAQSENYTFDNRGNLTSKTDSSGTTAYEWYYTNRLKKITFPNTTWQQYWYDGLGRRLKVSENGTERRFVYDGWNVIGEKRAGSENFVSYYTRGDDIGGGIGGIVSVHRNGTSAQYPNGYHTGDYFYHYNHRGDVVSVTNSAGAEVVHYRYDAFGNVEQKTGTFESPYQFSTKEYDTTSGLSYYGYRFFSLKKYYWLSKDPEDFDDGLNLYAFTINNPINWIDPEGSQSTAIQLAGGWSAAVAEPSAIGEIIMLGVSIYYIGNECFSKGGRQNIRDSGLENVSSEEIRRRARNKNLTPAERRRYQKEEKGRGLRNVGKR